MFTTNGGFYGFFRFDKPDRAPSLVGMKHRLARSLTGTALLMTVMATVAGDGVPIIFSGRDGRPVRFDFSRREALVPAEMKESRLGGSPGGPAAFIPLIDPSVTPNSATSRRQLSGSKPERDWIFQNPDRATTGEKKENTERVGKAEENVGAMMRYLKGEQPADSQSEKEINRASNDPEKSLASRQNENGDRFNAERRFSQELGGLNSRREGLLSRIENEAGLAGPDSRMALQNFFQAEQRRENETRHREQMTEFRQMLNNNSFGNPGLDNGFGAAPNPLQESLPGVSISTTTPGFGNVAAPNFSAGGFGQPSALPNAFDTPKVPVDMSRSRTFDERKPEPIRRQIKMDIPKRDF